MKTLVNVVIAFVVGETDWEVVLDCSEELSEVEEVVVEDGVDVDVTELAEGVLEGDALVVVDFAVLDCAVDEAVVSDVSVADGVDEGVVDVVVPAPGNRPPKDSPRSWRPAKLPSI